MAESYYLPPTVLMGAGSLHNLPAELNRIRGDTALLVTDQGIVEVGLAGRVQRVLEAAGKRVVLYDGVKPDPEIAQVAKGAELLQRHRCNLVVAVGGGSSIDCAKAITLVSTRLARGNLEKGEGLLPLIAVPTTAGTGSEATKYLVITDCEAREKMILVTQAAIPRIAVCDAELTLKLPPKITAATGIDALTHAIEAYLSTRATPFTDALALKAVAMIGDSLPRAVENGSDITAREAMMEAQFLAGLAFSNAGLGYVHAMAHPLGGLFHVPHGIANGLLLAPVMEFNLAVRARRLADVATALGEDTRGLAGRQAGERAIAAVKRLAARVGLPLTLREVGVTEKDLPELSARAARDPTRSAAPRPASIRELEELYRRVL